MAKAFNLVTPINKLGYGYAGLNVLKGLQNSGREVALWPLGPVDVAAEDEVPVRRAIGRAPFYDPAAPCLRLYHQFDMALFAGRGPRMGYPFFETTTLRSFEYHQLRALDRVVVSSQWAKRVLDDNGIPTDMIRVAPPGVDTSIFHPRTDDPIDVGRPTADTTVFLCCGKWEVRKGHDFVLDAFHAAFTPVDDVLLVMNCNNPLQPEVTQEFGRQYGESELGRAGKIKVVEGRLPGQHDLARLMTSADCGFFPARAEGWNLDAAEMLAMGKHVILTDYSAHAEFAGPAGARTIGIDKFETAYDGKWFHGDVGQWAHLGAPQLEQAVAHLREVHYQKQSDALTTNARGVEAFSTRFTWRNTVKHILEAAE